MIRKIMSEIDIKLGIKSIQQRVDDAFAKRPEVSVKQDIDIVFC
jgi:hypothetical protein